MSDLDKKIEGGAQILMDMGWAQSRITAQMVALRILSYDGRVGRWIDRETRACKEKLEAETWKMKSP